MRPILVLMMCLLGFAAQAEQSLERDGFVLRYATMSTASLTPEIAAQLGVTRSASRALLLVNAQRRNADGSSTPVNAEGTGTLRTLTGERRPLKLRKSGSGSDLIATIDLRSPVETFWFELQITPEGASAPMPLRFDQQIYRD
jgi:hypothetical protein